MSPSSGAGSGSPSRPLIRANNLSKHFGALRAVDGVNLSIQPGERRAVIGPNGAGKTTLFNLLTGELEPTGGQIILAGRDITHLPPHRRVPLGLGRTYQVTRLFPGLTVRENVQLAAQGTSREKFSFLARSLSVPSRVERLEQVLHSVKLGSLQNVPVEELSHGEKRQLEVALGLAVDPSVLLLDEPAAGLAPRERRDMFELIQSLPEDLTLILIEHDLDLALNLVDFVTCMYYGSILAEDDPEGIQDNPEVQNVYLGSPDGESNRAPDR